MENVKVIQCQGSVLIGQMMNDRQGEVMENPRALAIAPGQVQILELFGRPKRITIHNMLFSYDADEELSRHYAEAVTGLSITTQMPKVLQGGRG